jgi:hypothetical protein
LRGVPLFFSRADARGRALARAGARWRARGRALSDS